MKRSTDRIRTTHVGALPWTGELSEAFRNRRESPEAFGKLLPGAVIDTVRKQREVGVDVVNDGEQGKAVWSWYVMNRLGGYEYRPADIGKVLKGEDQMRFAEFYMDAMQSGLWYGETDALTVEAYSQTPVCTGPVTYDDTEVQRDIANLRAAVDETGAEEAFLPVAAPASIEFGQENEYYASQEEYVWALAEALKQEYEAIAGAGFLVQLDDAWVPALWNAFRPDIDLETYRRYCMMRIEATNHALSGIPPEQVRYHACWGSWHGPHASDIPMSELVHLMLKVNAGAYLFEAANVRHEHEFVVWDDVKLPDGKIIVPGVVSHATTILEHPELVAQRLVRFAERVGRENVIASTDCGLGGRVHPQLVWAKLQAMAEGAEIASRRLWKA